MPPPPSASDARLSVGALARASGLTVRALHHYDRLGLVRPSERTAAGHRRYTPADVARLQTVASLRALDVPLAAIAEALDGAPDPAALLRRHAAHVRDRQASLAALAARLDGAARMADAAGPLPLDTLLSLLRQMHAVQPDFTPDERAAIEQRGQALGLEGLRAVEAEWPRLIAAMTEAQQANRPVDAPDVQALARRWKELVSMFSGGDAAVESKVQRTYEANPEMAAAMGLTPALTAYVGRAMAALG